MINPNRQLLKWLLSVEHDRRTELLCDIGSDQEKKGISKRTIVQIYKQLSESPTVKVKPLKKYLEKKLLTRNGEIKEDNLFLNSDINVSECLRENECDTETVEDVCLPVITSVISLRDDDEDSIEISLSEEDTCENKEDTCENKDNTCENKDDTCENKEDACENKENTERKLEDKLKHGENIMISITQTQVDTPKLTPNEKLHLEVQEIEKGEDNIGKTSNNIENHQVECNDKYITTNQPILCTKDTKNKMDTLQYNSLVAEQNKQNKKQIMILKEVLRHKLESKNVSLPFSKNCKSLDTKNNISQSRQKLSPPIKKLGVECSTESKEEYTGINSSEMIESVQMEVEQLEKSTSELSTEGNDGSTIKLNRTKMFYLNPQQHKNNTKMDNPSKEFVSFTPTNQRLPNKKRPADQIRGTQQVSKRRRMSATDIVDRSLSLKQLLSDSCTQFKQPSDKIHENPDYSFLSRSLSSVPIPRRYSLDLNSSMTKQNGSQVLLDISLRGKSNTNNTTKGHNQEFTESMSCVYKDDVEPEICSAEEIVTPTVIDNGRSYSCKNLENSLGSDNILTEDSVKAPANQLLAVTRSTAPTNKAPDVSTCTSSANQAPTVQKCTDLANQAPVIPTSTVTANELPIVAICTAPVSGAPSFPCSTNQASALLTCTAMANQSPPLPTCTVPANQTPVVPTCTASVNQTLGVPTCPTTANQSPALPTCPVPANQTPAVLTCTDPVNQKLAVQKCTAPMNQGPAVPKLVCNALANDRSKQSFIRSIHTAVILFFDNLESGQTVNRIPPAIRSELFEFLTIKGKNGTDDRNLLQLYMLCYREFFDRDVSAKINKCAEILHLAISDYNRKEERKKRALRLSSDTFRREEEMRAHNEYSEMLNLRGIKFSEIFDSILVHFKYCASSMTVTLYYRITLALINIDSENIIYTYTIRKLILELLKRAEHLRRVPPCSFNLFQAPRNDFEDMYIFVKTCLVILDAVGYCQNSSEDVLKFANLPPTSLKIQNVLIKHFNRHAIETLAAIDYTRQWESGIANTYTNSNIIPNNEMSTLKNNTNATFVNSRNTGITSESLRGQRQIQETFKLPQHQLLQQSKNSYRDIAVQNSKFQSSTSELINQQQINIANSKIPHLLSNNDMQNRGKFTAIQQTPKNSILLTTASQHMYNRQSIQVTTPNNVLNKIPKTHPSQQTPHQQTYLRHNTFTSENVNQREAEKMSRSDPHTVRESQEMGANSQEVTNTASFNIQDTTANSQTASSSNSGQGQSSNLKNNLSFSNRNLSYNQVCDVANCSVYATLVCSLCKAMFYCSHACQNIDWYSGHSNACQGLRLQNQD